MDRRYTSALPLLCTRRAEHFLLTPIVNYSWRVIFWTRPARAVTLQGPTTTARPINAIRSALLIRRSHQLVRVQAIFFRRRHQPSRPPPAKIRPGRPAPAMGPGTAAGVMLKSATPTPTNPDGTVTVRTSPFKPTVADKVFNYGCPRKCRIGEYKQHDIGEREVGHAEDNIECIIGEIGCNGGNRRG